MQVLPLRAAAFALLAVVAFGTSCVHRDPSAGTGACNGVGAAKQAGAVAICCKGGLGCSSERDGVTLRPLGEGATCRFAGSTVSSLNRCVEEGGTVYLCNDVPRCDSNSCLCSGGRC